MCVFFMLSMKSLAMQNARVTQAKASVLASWDVASQAGGGS